MANPDSPDTDRLPVSPEQVMIQEVFAPLTAAHRGADGLRDDAALIDCGPGGKLVVTMDMVVAGVHFLEDDSPDQIARKALRVNLSDLAAKGAKPVGYLVGLALADAGDRGWLERFASGLERDQHEFDCCLVGGDTVATPGPLTVSITAYGVVETGRMVRRSGGRAGDIIYCSGTIGDATLGLALRRGENAAWNDMLPEADRDYLLGRYLVPRPRVSLAAAISEFCSASMDVSDGFSGDLGLLCRASGMGAEIDIDNIPLSAPALRLYEADAKVINRFVTGGDDYEIICCVDPDHASAFESAAAAAAVPICRVGRLTVDRVIRFVDSEGDLADISSGSYSHL